jgi:hypothetical protein
MPGTPDTSRQGGLVDPLGSRAVEDQSPSSVTGAPGVDARLRIPAQIAKEPHRDRQRERDHLDRERRTLAEPAHELGLVGDDHHPPGGRRDHLLAQVRASQALDQVQRRVDLVGAVDHDIELGDVREREERDPPLAAALGRRGGRGHAGDIGSARASRSPSASSIFAAVGPRRGQAHPRADEAVDGRGAGHGLEAHRGQSRGHRARDPSASVSGARQAARSQMYTAGRPSTSPLPSSGTPAAPVPSPSAYTAVGVKAAADGVAQAAGASSRRPTTTRPRAGGRVEIDGREGCRMRAAPGAPCRAGSKCARSEALRLAIAWIRRGG